VEPLERVNRPAMRPTVPTCRAARWGSGGPFIVALAGELKANSLPSHKLRYIRFHAELRSAFRVTRHNKLATILSAVRTSCDAPTRLTTVQ
jgi:hypothetical protein